MHLERRGTGWQEVYDATACPGCGKDWTPGRGGYRVGTLPCECAAPEKAHRILACKSCTTEVYEPEHVPQMGPTASYGRTTHRPVEG